MGSIQDAIKLAKQLKENRELKESNKSNDSQNLFDSFKRETDEKNKRLEAELEAMRQKTAELERARSSDANFASLQERMSYAKRSGIKVSDETLARILPNVDLKTQEGVVAMEKFKQENLGLFGPQAPKAADISADVTKKITEKSAREGGKQPVSERKIFGNRLIKTIIDKNLGGE
jgi:hypothetical protein